MDVSTDLIAKIRRRGVHFDLRGKRVARYADLVNIGGLYKLEDIKKRLPLGPDEIQEMQASGSLTNVFYYLDGVYYIDIEQLNLQLVAKIKKTKWHSANGQKRHSVAKKPKTSSTTAPKGETS